MGADQLIITSNFDRKSTISIIASFAKGNTPSMPQTLYEFINSSDHNGKNIAGYLFGPAPKKFRYYQSSNPMLPAFVNALQGPGKNKKIYTNYNVAPWVKHIVSNVKGKTSLTMNQDDGAAQITPERVTDIKWPNQIIARDGNAPLAGGLHAAATAIKDGNKNMTDGSTDKGLKRALRYYMLASYSLLDLSAEESFAGLKNYVGAILVSDKGKILAAGINTGSFRHAEVSMLLSYFRNNPGARALPAKSVVFSTLTPCKQCTAYLTEAKTADTVIYFGQEDTGKDGRKGKKISAQLSKKTDAPLGRSKTKLTGSVTEEDSSGVGVVSSSTASGIHRVRIAKGLSDCMGKGSIAVQIGSALGSRSILSSASNALIHKVIKDRPTDNDEERVKSAVLHYLTYWIGTASSAA